MKYHYHSYMKLQRKELEEHKYYLSEREGRDIGWEATLINWVESGHAERFNKAYLQHLNQAERLAELEDIPNKLIHIVLEDGLE